MTAEPQEQHQWLHRMLGEWIYEGECSMGPDQPASKSMGSETVRSLGGLWILCEGRGEMPDGGPATWLCTLGYDPQRQRFVGTWIGSMMSHLWVYDGELDAAGTVLTLAASGPSMAAPEKTGQYRDIIELKDDDHRVQTSHTLGDDGAWHHFMTASYRRKT